MRTRVPLIQQKSKLQRLQHPPALLPPCHTPLKPLKSLKPLAIPCSSHAWCIVLINVTTPETEKKKEIIQKTGRTGELPIQRDEGQEAGGRGVVARGWVTAANALHIYRIIYTKYICIYISTLPFTVI